MKKFLFGLTSVAGIVMASLALAQTGGAPSGGGMMAERAHGYGMGYGFYGWWVLYGAVKAAVVLFGLWLLHRIAKAVEKIAASKS